MTFAQIFVDCCEQLKSAQNSVNSGGLSQKWDGSEWAELHHSVPAAYIESQGFPVYHHKPSEARAVGEARPIMASLKKGDRRDGSALTLDDIPEPDCLGDLIKLLSGSPPKFESHSRTESSLGNRRCFGVEVQDVLPVQDKPTALRIILQCNFNSEILWVLASGELASTMLEFCVTGQKQKDVEQLDWRPDVVLPAIAAILVIRDGIPLGKPVNEIWNKYPRRCTKQLYVTLISIS
jgi:hypothetical protein